MNDEINNCPHCGAEIDFGNGNFAFFKCGVHSVYTVCANGEQEAERTPLCREREDRQKAEAERDVFKQELIAITSDAMKLREDQRRVTRKLLDIVFAARKGIVHPQLIEDALDVLELIEQDHLREQLNQPTK
jgi:hypothetical protein